VKKNILTAITLFLCGCGKESAPQKQIQFAEITVTGTEPMLVKNAIVENLRGLNAPANIEGAPSMRVEAITTTQAQYGRAFRSIVLIAHTSDHFKAEGTAIAREDVEIDEIVYDAAQVMVTALLKKEREQK
jgi:hypothetical protein